MAIDDVKLSFLHLRSLIVNFTEIIKPKIQKRNRFSTVAYLKFILQPNTFVYSNTMRKV